VSGKATAFSYDGLGRRTTITSTPAGGGSAVMTSYLWCGSDICQARNAGNATIRSYYNEGEFVPGTPAQPYYYGIDQIGSVRRGVRQHQQRAGLRLRSVWPRVASHGAAHRLRLCRHVLQRR
jgi:hypothetical protein